MKKILLVLFTFLISISSEAQVTLPVKVDTTKHRNFEIYRFVQKYMEQDTIDNTFWHPKYQNRKTYNYTMDWLWGRYTPKKLAEKYHASLVELQHLDDTLSYFKLMLTSIPKKNENSYSNVYKYYVVNVNGRYYLDNSKEYETKRFRQHTTKNIVFYTSPFYPDDKKEMEKASVQLEALYRKLNKPHLKKPIEYYRCSTEEELNALSNIVVWDGGLGGYTNIPEGFVVAINKSAFYTHEFIHAILESSTNCFFLQEGIASLYGGPSKDVTYEQGIQQLKKSYELKKCNFDMLYKREVFDQYNSNLTYTFAATFCKYIIDQYGLDFFYKLYYDNSINTNNFIEKVMEKTGKDREEIRIGVEKIFL